MTEFRAPYRTIQEAADAAWRLSLYREWEEDAARETDERVQRLARICQQQAEALELLTGGLDDWKARLTRLEADMQRVVVALDLRRGPTGPAAVPPSPPANPRLPKVIP